MTGHALYQALRAAGLVVPRTTDADVIAEIERLETEDLAAKLAGRYPGDNMRIVLAEEGLRDRFAMAALAGFGVGVEPEKMSRLCYEVADCMMSARSQDHETEVEHDGGPLEDSCRAEFEKIHPDIEPTQTIREYLIARTAKASL